MEFKKYNIKKGFTLIEMLLVITIIGILSTIIISQYARTTKSAKLVALTDELISEIKETRDLSILGFKNKYGENYNCYGLSFFREGSQNLVWRVVGTYKIFDDGADRCVFNAGDGELESFELPKMFNVNDVYYLDEGSKNNKKEFIVFFRPPDGRMMSVQRGNSPNQDPVRIIIGSPNQDLNSLFVKAITIQSTGKIDVLVEEEES